MNEGDDMSEVDDLLKLSAEVQVAQQEVKLEDLKDVLEPIVDELMTLESEKRRIELLLKEHNKKIADQETKIRTVWGPHILGTDKASIDFGRFKLSSEQKLNVAVSDDENSRDFAVEWLKTNGYEDCLKWDVNTNTLKAIAVRELKEKEVKIPGLKYSTFNKVSVK